jgi:hypothetical protein
MSNRKRVVGPAGLGYVVDDIQKEANHLTTWQKLAAALLMQHMSGVIGSSDGLVGQMSTKVDCSTRPRAAPPNSYGSVNHQIAQVVSSLRPHEKDLLSRIARGRGGCLADYGKVKSGFQVNRTARAFAIGRVSALLDTVAELAQLKPEIPSHPT